MRHTLHEWHNVGNPDVDTLPAALYRDFFQLPLDDLPGTVPEFERDTKNHFTSCEWYGVYDFVEFLANVSTIELYAIQRFDFIRECNAIMERELSA